MIDHGTRFAKVIKELKPPSSLLFSLADWEDAFAAGPATESDKRLLEVARWIGKEVAAIPEFFRNQALATLNSEWSTILAIAALNREYRTAVDLAREAIKAAADAGTLAIDALAALRIKGVDGQEISAADLAEIGTDTTENWLFDANQATGKGDSDIVDLGPIAVQATQYYSFRKGLNSLWNSAWYRGWNVEIDSSGINRWRPSNPEHERLELAWRSRQEANLMNFPQIDRTVWPKLSPTERRQRARKFSVLSVNDRSTNLVFKIGAISYLSKRMPYYMFEKGMLEGSYISDFISSPFPLDTRLSVALLQVAWHTLLDIANLLSSQVELPGKLSPDDARKLALAVKRETLVDALTKSLKIKADLAEVIISFLTFEFQTGGRKKPKGNKGLWAAPLVPLPTSDELLLALPVFATSNPARRAEAWLEKGGITDDNPAGARGDRYEVLYRSKICKALHENKLLPNARSAKDGVAKSSKFDEQIDLLVAFGGLCLVGEVKFFLMPVDPHEQQRYANKLEEAAEQVNRKTLSLQKRPDVIAAALGINETESSALKLLPIVVTNQGYGFSTRVKGVLILEAGYTRTYLGAGEIITGMAVDSLGRRSSPQTINLYIDETSAAANFERHMSSPYVLSRFLNRISWQTTNFPTLTQGLTLIEVPVLGDVADYDRMRAEELVAQLI